MRAFAQALKSIRRSPYQALAALLILFLTFFVGYALALFLLGSAKAIEYFETRPQVTGFFKQDTTGDQLQQNADTLKQNSFITNVKIISQEQALDIYKEQTSNDPLLQELVTADILPPSLEVSTNTIDSLQSAADAMKTLPGIDEVVYQQDVIDQLRTYTQNLRRIGVGVLVMFTVASLLVVILITSIRIASKKYEIKVMRLVGATKWYIMRPFLIEGMLYGIVGALLSWIAVYIGVLYASPALESFLGEIHILPVPPQLMLALLGGGVLAAILLGFFASLVSTRRLFRV